MVWVCYYPGSEIKQADSIKWDSKADHLRVMADRTRTLDQTFARFGNQENTLPAGVRDIPDYYAQMAEAGCPHYKL